MRGLPKYLMEVFLVGMVGVIVYIFRAEIMNLIARARAPKLADDGLKMFG